MTLGATKKSEPREPTFLDLKNAEIVNAKLADLDIVLVRCGASPSINLSRKAIAVEVNRVLVEMLNT